MLHWPLELKRLESCVYTGRVGQLSLIQVDFFFMAILNMMMWLMHVVSPFLLLQMVTVTLLLLSFLLAAPLVSSSPLAKVTPHQEMVARYSTTGEKDTQEAPQV